MRDKGKPEGAGSRLRAFFFAEHPFFLPAGVVLTVFLITRLPFFIYYPVVGIGHDTGDYLVLAKAIGSGTLPHFIIRTPGYPLFIWLVTSFCDRWLAVIFVQNLLTLASSLFIVFAVLRLSPRLALPAALAMCGYVGSSQVLLHDTYTISDSLYANSLIFTVALLLLALNRSRPLTLLCLSAMMAITILVRPAGMYLVAIYLFILVYLFLNRFTRAELRCFAPPLPIMLLALCTYNFFTIGEFAISPWGDAAFVGATILYWEQDPSLPPFVNNALKGLPDSYKKVGLTADDMVTLKTSWNVASLSHLYGKSSDPLIHGEGWGFGSRFTGGDFLQNRMYIRQVSLMAIRRHPILYIKYCWANLVTYWTGIALNTDFYSAVAVRGSMTYVTKNRGYEKWKAKEFADSPPPVGVLIGPSGTPQNVTLASTSLSSLHRGWQSLHWKVFQRLFWVWAYFATFILSVGKLIRSRGRNLGAFILCTLGLTAIGASLVICLIARSVERYSYPTQFICYLSVALLPLLWVSKGTRRDAV